METGGNRKIYHNALLFNHHSLCMNITLDTPLHKLFFKNMINISCFLWLNREIYVLMLRNMYWCWEIWVDIWCAYLFFPGFYKYGKNVRLSRLKIGSRKYGRDTPPPASRPISVFFRKYGNGRDKYRNTDGTGRTFSSLAPSGHCTNAHSNPVNQQLIC